MGIQTISLNNELRTLPKTSFKDFIQNEMAIQAIKESQRKMGQIIFDEEYYESLDMICQLLYLLTTNTYIHQRL